MPSITLNTTFSNPNLPSSKTLAEQIGEIPSLAGWFQMDPNYVSLAGNSIVQIFDRAGGAGVFSANGSYAEMVADAVGQYPAARFAGTTAADNSSYGLSGVDVDTDADYTYVALFKASDNVDGDTIIGRFKTSSERSILNVITSSQPAVRLYHGTSGAIKHDITIGEWCLAIAAYDASAGVLKLYADGVTYPVVAASGTSGNSANITLGAMNAGGGQGIDGQIADVLIFSSDLFKSSADLDLVKKYFLDVYGV